MQEYLIILLVLKTQHYSALNASFMSRKDTEIFAFLVSSTGWTVSLVIASNDIDTKLAETYTLVYFES
jgi:hypothetical protein